MSSRKRIKSVAVVGAGASGAITAAALKAENYYDRIQVFERRGTTGGTWIYDPEPPELDLLPGALPPISDPPVSIPDHFPQNTQPNEQQRYHETPIYDSLTTNVPDIAMSFSDASFAYGPFAPHWVPRQYLENYFSTHQTDSFLVLNTTLERLVRVPSPLKDDLDSWKLTLRKHDVVLGVDSWWEEEFDAVVLANGHYSIPFLPLVLGLEAYMARFPGRVTHSKTYRQPGIYAGKRVVIVGNSASGHDVAQDLVLHVEQPLYVSRRSRARWEGDQPPAGIEWKPAIREYREDGTIVFSDKTQIHGIDAIIYCTGYQPSYPFWDEKANGAPLYDYTAKRLVGSYWHTFFRSFQTLAIVGMPRVLTFRSFEYQAIAIARLFAGRQTASLPSTKEQEEWERQWEAHAKKANRKFHEIEWDNGETEEWLHGLYKIAGLGTIRGDGRVPPVLDGKLRWAVEHLSKYPKGKAPDRGTADAWGNTHMGLDEWVMVERMDTLAFI